jgi:hypothetical protein
VYRRRVVARRTARAGAAIALALALAAGAARAEPAGDGAVADAAAAEAAPPVRPWHGALGLGGFAALTGPGDLGPSAVVELSPGGAFGRYGARVEARGLGGTGSDGYDDYLMTGGLIFEAAAARPRLVLSLHAELGAYAIAGDHGAAAGAGITTQLTVVGPLAIGLDTTATLFVRGVDSELALASALSLRLFH